jgi:hypothetical protein
VESIFYTTVVYRGLVRYREGKWPFCFLKVQREKRYRRNLHVTDVYAYIVHTTWQERREGEAKAQQEAANRQW